jgi:ketosteroid isomerase-like protein
MSDEDAIRALLGERIEAMRTRDAARAVATLAPAVVAFELAAPLSLAAGQARDVAALQAWFDGWAGPIEIETCDLQIAVSGDVGFCHSLNRLSATRANRTRSDFWVRSTLGFRKTDGVWKIAHGHTSVPFAMDGSYRALLDLEP